MSSIQIYKYENRRYVFDTKTFADIMSTSKDNKIALYSMTGPLRTGKSFMLSLFLKYLKNRENVNWIEANLENAFTYKGGSVRETTGI